MDSAEIRGWASVLREKRKEKYLAYVREWEARIGSFLIFDPERCAESSSPEGALAGIPFGVKDNIAVESFPMTCASRLLEALEVPYTATAVKRLQRAGAIVVGKTNLDEFAMGSSTDNSALGKTSNPWDVTRVAGGSSGGSAAAVAAGLVPFALGSDTGGSVRQPAHFCGVYGLKPTYGGVSRYGLVAYATSLDCMGILARTVAMTERVFNIIKGCDPMDASSMAHTPYEGEVKRVGIATGPGLAPGVKRAVALAVQRLHSLSYQTVSLPLKTLDYVVPTYCIIANIEATSNLARYDGLLYGTSSVPSHNRGKGVMGHVRQFRYTHFGKEVRTRLLLGTHFLQTESQHGYYARAKRMRMAITREISEAFEKVDLLLMPGFPTAAFLHGSAEMNALEQRRAEGFLQIANFVGCPALALPTSLEEGLPCGVQLMAKPHGEPQIFQVARALERLYPIPEPPRFEALW